MLHYQTLKEGLPGGPRNGDDADPALGQGLRLKLAEDAGDQPRALPRISGCGEYPGDDAVLSAQSGELTTPPPEAAQTAFDGRSLEAVRSLVARVANEARLSPERFSDLMLAASELAANSVRHAGGGGLARAWHTTQAVFCEVEDAGSIGDPLVGRRRPSLSVREGRGLWLVNHLCDLVEVRSAAGRTVVRVQVRS